MENNRNYFMRRAAQERSAASHAEGKAREAHRQLAKSYGKLVRLGDAPQVSESLPTA